MNSNCRRYCIELINRSYGGWLVGNNLNEPPLSFFILGQN